MGLGTVTYPLLVTMAAMASLGNPKQSQAITIGVTKPAGPFLAGTRRGA